MRRSLLALTGACLLIRAATLPAWIQNADGYYFIDGVVRYTVSELRPHFPGYPVFIWSGKLLALLLGDVALAVRLVSVLASTLALWPIAFLARDWAVLAGVAPENADRSGVLAALAWILAPLPWLCGTELYSDSMGICLALFVLWLCFRALAQPETATRVLPLAAGIGGVMLGTRLAHLPLLLPLAYALLRARRAPRVIGRSVLAFALAVAVWMGWQFSRDGFGLIQGGIVHLRRHTFSPEITVVGDTDWIARTRDFHSTLPVHGLGGWAPGAPLHRLPATLVWPTLFLIAGSRLIRAPRHDANRLVWLFALPYALGILLFYEVRFPRYHLPLVAVAAVLAGMGRPSARRPGTIAVLALLLSLASVSVPLAIEHQSSEPLPSQLARFAREELNPTTAAIVFSAADAEHDAVIFRRETPEEFTVTWSAGKNLAVIERRFRERGLTVYSTAPPAWAPEEWVPVARFCRSVYVDPRGTHEMWLFRRQPGNGFTAVPGCRYRPATPWCGK